MGRPQPQRGFDQADRTPTSGPAGGQESDSGWAFGAAGMAPSSIATPREVSPAQRRPAPRVDTQAPHRSSDGGWWTMAMDVMTAPRVLVVDDEETIAELVGSALRYEGYEVEQAYTGRTTLERVGHFRPHLVLLDIQLPDLDGFEVQRRLRNDGREVPVLFLTARDATEDKVRGLALGADDYVTKPFSVDELIARVRAILRRSGADRSATSSLLTVCDLELSDAAHEVWRGERQIILTPTEFRLLRFLMLNVRQVVSKSQILDYVWEFDFGGDTNIVETYISYLRKKIDVDTSEPLIHTVRGVGYCLRTTP
jgi:two-component system, OmpR family, response regulator